jgi:threonine dehydrogenase-like Zn-dependent dehydrogenase
MQSAFYDKAKQAVRLETDRPTALRQVMVACGKGGHVSLAGVYGGFLDKIPMGAAFNKGLTFKMGQTHVIDISALTRTHPEWRD